LINLYFFGRKMPGVPSRRWLHLDSAQLRPLWGFGAMALLGGLASQGCLLFVRSTLGEQLGWSLTGQWQALQKISEIYLTLATTTLTLYYLPRLSSIDNRAGFIALLAPAMAWILPCTLVGSTIVYLARDWIIRTAFTPEFGPIADLMHIQLSADILRIASYLFAMVMWAKRMVRVFVVMECGFALTYGLSTALLTPTLGLAGALWAQVLSYACYLIASLFVAFRLAPWSEAHKK
jgi:PST family polysaccharide transporter